METFFENIKAFRSYDQFNTTTYGSKWVCPLVVLYSIFFFFRTHLTPVALYGPLYIYIYIYIYLRTIGLRFSLIKNFQHCAKKNLTPLFCQFLSWNRLRERSNIYIFRFIRYLSTFFHTYLSINIHFQFIIITNISFVTNPAYFVHHLASPVVSFWGHMIIPNIILFIYKPQTRVWFAYTDEWWNYQTNMLSTVNSIVNQRHHLETYTFPISSMKNTNSIEFFLCIAIYIGYQTLLVFFFRSNKGNNKITELRPILQRESKT